MPIDDLGPQAAELLSLTYGGEARSLDKLAELAAWQVPACAGAHAAVWRDGEVIGTAAITGQIVRDLGGVPDDHWPDMKSG